jgi:hypothetical protein
MKYYALMLFVTFSSSHKCVHLAGALLLAFYVQGHMLKRLKSLKLRSWLLRGISLIMNIIRSLVNFVSSDLLLIFFHI